MLTFLSMIEERMRVPKFLTKSDLSVLVGES